MKQIKQAIEEAKHVVFLTGAGISTDSGISDYRGAKGYGIEIDFETMLSLQAFKDDPENFWMNIYNVMKWHDLASKEPNDGHKWIASLENENRRVTVLTQNIDGLHTKAGSSNVINLHGNIYYGTCLNGHVQPINLSEQEIPYCPECEAIIKPSVVLYGEDVNEYMKALQRTLEADVFIAMGTTLKVHPVDTLIEQARFMTQSQVFIVNNEITKKIECCHKFYHKNITEFVQEFNL